MNEMSSLAPASPPEQAVNRFMQLYYRHRQNGVVVFRMEVANRQRRIELNQIASISKRGEVTPHKRRPPTDAEMAEIETWMTNWQARVDADDLNTTESFLVELNQFTDWVQRRAEHAEVDALSDTLLMAILDLRQVVVRRLPEDAVEDDE